MTCKICGKKLPDGSTVCKYCGTELRRPQQKSKRYSKKGKARKRMADAIVLLLALIVIAGVVAAIAWSTDKAADEANESVETVETAEEKEVEIVEEEIEEKTEEKTEETPAIEIVGEDKEEELPETLTGTEAVTEEAPEEEAEEAPAVQTPSGNYTVSINRTEVTASVNKYRELTLTVNETLPAGVSVKSLVWTAADPSIVRTETVDGVGRAWGLKVGKTTVTGQLTLTDGQSYTASCEVTVAEKQEETVKPSNGYILADSSTRLYSTSELKGLTSEQLWYARNEIFARHGRKFSNPTLQAYFNAQSWYKGTIEADAFDYFSLSDTERKNIETIEAIEASR